MSTYTARYRRTDDSYDHEARGLGRAAVAWIASEGRLIYAVPTGREGFASERIAPIHFILDAS